MKSQSPTRARLRLTSITEIFNWKMDEIIEGLGGVVKSMDNFLVLRKDTEEHKIRLRKFLYRLKLHGITLYLDKYIFRVDRT